MMTSSNLFDVNVYPYTMLSLQNGTFNINSIITNQGTLEFYSGSFAGSGTINSTGVFAWTGGNITGNLQFDVTDCVIGGSFLHVLERDVTFKGICCVLAI